MSTDGVSFKQWNNFARFTLTFFSDYVAFDYVGQAGRRAGYNVRYESLPTPFYYKSLRPLDYYLLLPLFAGGSFGLLELLLHPQKQANFVQTLHLILFVVALTLILCAIGLALRPFLRKDYTVLPTTAGNIVIARRGDHDRIIAQLEERRLAALKKLAVIDPMGQPWTEVKKFRWLRDQGAISNEEFRAYAQTILYPVPRAMDAAAPVIH